MPAAGRTYGSRPKSKPPKRSSSGVAPNFPSYVPPRPGATRRPAPRPTPAPRPRPAPTPPRSSSGIAPNFPRYVPKRPGALPPPKPKPPPPPTKIARAQEQQFKSQAGAVRRVAKTQARLGPGVAVRPLARGRQVLTDQRIAQAAHDRAAKATEQSYKSLGESVAKQATQQQATRSVKVGGFKVPAAAYSKDPAVLKAAGFKKAGTSEALASLPFRAVKSAPKDLAELAVTTPTSLAHLGVEGFKLSSKVAIGDYLGAGKQGLKIAKEQLAPYGEAIKHPVKFATEHPVTSYLMFAPGVKLPLRGGARAARLAGKSTLKREPATLPGTAVREARTVARQPGGLDVAKQLRGRTGSTVTRKELQRRVDEHHDLARHHEERRVAQVVKATKQQTEHLPKPERTQAIADATAQARVDARAESQARFVREFGANVRPSTGAAEVKLTKRERVQAKQRKGAAKSNVKQAEAAHAEALAGARIARGRSRRTPQLTALESERRVAHQVLAKTQQEARQAETGYHTAHRQAAVSQAKPATSPKLQELHSQRRAVERVMLGPASTPRPSAGPAYTGPSVAVLEKRVAGHEQALARQKAAGVNGGRGNMDTIAALNQGRTLLAEARKAVPEPVAKIGEVHAARADVRTADRRVNTIGRQLQRAEERASHLEGVTVGRAKAGGMTAAAGRMAADQAERVGHLNDALTEARRHASDARDRLKQVEQGHRGRVREATKAIDAAIRAENRRIAGVAPTQHASLLSAIEQRATAPARVREARGRVRGVERRIAAEQQRTAGVPPAEADALLRAIHARDVARETARAAREAHGAAKRTHIATERAHRQAALVSPTAQGRTFTHKQDAQRVAKQLNAQAQEIPAGGVPFGSRLREPGAGGKAVALTRGHGSAPLEFTWRKVGDEHYAVVPKIASQRMYGGGTDLSHASVGSGKATGAKLMRQSRGAFTQATLPLSLKWLGGQGAEAGIRALVAGAGPRSRALYKRVVDRMNELEPGAGDEFAMRVRGGQFGSSSAIAEQFGGKTLAEDFQGTPLKTPAALATAAGETAPAQLVRSGWRRYSHGVMQGVNGLVENATREAMAGKALKEGPHLERRVAGFEQMRELMGKTNRAVEDAAKGLLDTHSQVEAVRRVDEMYGKYSRWSPEMRSLLLHWTPFLPWYLNTLRFLAHTLPERHPVKAAALANANVADQEWRKQQGLSLYGKKHVPDFLMGSYPTGKDRYLRVGHYTPWGIGADVAGSVAGLALPQVLGPIKNLSGVDWKWQPLTKPGAKGQRKRPFNLGDRSLRALVTVLEEQVPGVAQAGRLTGLTPSAIDKRTNVPGLRERLMKELPTTPTASAKKKPKATKQPLGGGFGGGGGLGGGAGIGGGW